MNQPQLFKWGITLTLVMSLLSGCGTATSTPIVLPPEPASNEQPQPIPQVIVPQPTAIRTATIGPFSAASVTPTPTAGTITPAPSATLKPPIDRPFLMRIDRISVIVGRGTLLQGRVANGTLPANASIEIFDSQNNVISPTLLAILIANTARDQVTVGDYASILVAGVQATDLAPGMLLAEAGEYDSYEEALQQLQ